MLNERVHALRQQSLDAAPHLSHERAVLVTEAYRSIGPQSAPMLRAQVFTHILENKTIVINDGELIVGERGPAPKATSTYPEICCHSLQDLDILNSRPKIPYGVTEEARSTYESSIIPFWKGKSLREMIFEQMTAEWKDSYTAGIFTEFMEQRAPGHTVLDDKIYRKGMLDFKLEIQNSIDSLDFKNDTEASTKLEELRSMLVCADAIVSFARRYADLAGELARTEDRAERRRELLTIADVCTHVPAHPPRNFWEALQYYWFIHLGVITELNPWDAFNPGRLDQHLHPFYKEEIAKGTISHEKARELLQCFWIKFNNQPAPPKVGVTAAESATYTDFANINTGGLTPAGEDGVNDVSYLILEVIDEMRLVQPSSNIQLARKNPDQFLKKALGIVRKGWGQPSIFNADMVVEELLRQGKSLEDARQGGTSGCVETGAFGKESYILTGYFNLPKILEITLHNGVDPKSGKTLGLRTGDPASFVAFDQFLAAFEKQVRHFVDIKMRGNQVIERLYARHLPTPFLSILIDDCIARGKDYSDGGARYNTNYIQGVGIGTLTDCLSAIKFHVFDEKTIAFPDLVRILDVDFEGYEKTRVLLLNRTPRYGNDDPYADSILKQAFEIYHNAIDGRKNTKGGVYRINLLPTTCHIYFGSVTGATADGRKAWKPLSEGISPVQGMDRNGPTAVLKSASKIDHARTGGTLLNQKFTPQLLQDERGLEGVAHLVRTYFTLGGHHIQFNVVDAATLRKAQERPEEHRDLIVRVAGYSDYFCDLGKDLQEEIISRTEHHTL
jgi:formate C-acetyltransferase